MSTDEKKQLQPFDGIDPNRVYDLVDFCTRLRISRNRSRQLAARARDQPGVIVNGYSLIATGSLLCDLLAGIPQRKRTVRAKKRKTPD